MPSAIFPLLALAGLFFLTSAVLAGLLVSSMDEGAAQEKKRMIAGALARETSSLVATANDYAFWDDAVDHIYGHPDDPWLISNFGGALPLFVIGEKGQTIFGWQADRQSGGGVLRRDAPAAMRAILPRLTARPARTQTSTIRPLVQFYRGRPALFAIAPIMPFSKDHPLPSGPMRYVVVVRPLDEPLLQSWQKAYAIRDLAWAPPGRAVDLDAAQPLGERPGDGLGHIRWTPVAPGVTALRKLVGLLAGATLLFLLLFVAASRSIVRAHLSLLAGQRQAERISEEREAARLAAEDARMQAEKAREEVARIAAKEAREQAEHRQALKDAANDVAALLSASIGDLASTLLRQADELEASAQGTNKALAEQLHVAATVRKRSRASADAVGRIQAHVLELSTAIGQIREQSVATRQTMKKTELESQAAVQANLVLQREIEAIDLATRSVGQIARRTNLLALNATIEAVRVGHEGAGFAVVAGEIKTLADQAAGMTGQIEQRVGDVNSAALSVTPLLALLHGLIGQLDRNVSDVTLAAERHHAGARTIFETSQSMGADAESVHGAIEAISAELETVKAAAAHTLNVSAAVRGSPPRADRAIRDPPRPPACGLRLRGSRCDPVNARCRHQRTGRTDRTHRAGTACAPRKGEIGNFREMHATSKKW